MVYGPYTLIGIVDCSIGYVNQILRFMWSSRLSAATGSATQATKQRSGPRQPRGHKQADLAYGVIGLKCIAHNPLTLKPKKGLEGCT